jgi:hypothetical protein
VNVVHNGEGQTGNRDGGQLALVSVAACCFQVDRNFDHFKDPHLMLSRKSDSDRQDAAVTVTSEQGRAWLHVAQLYPLGDEASRRTGSYRTDRRPSQEAVPCSTCHSSVRFTLVRFQSPASSTMVLGPALGDTSGTGWITYRPPSFLRGPPHQHPQTSPPHQRPQTSPPHVLRAHSIAIIATPPLCAVAIARVGAPLLILYDACWSSLAALC